MNLSFRYGLFGVILPHLALDGIKHLSELKVEDPVKAIKEAALLGGPGNLQLDKYRTGKPL